MSDRLPWWRIFPWEFLVAGVASVIGAFTVDKRAAIGLVFFVLAASVFTSRRAHESRVRAVGAEPDVRDIAGPVWARAIVLLASTAVICGIALLHQTTVVVGVALLALGLLGLVIEQIRVRRLAYNRALRAILDEREHEQEHDRGEAPPR